MPTTAPRSVRSLRPSAATPARWLRALAGAYGVAFAALALAQVALAPDAAATTRSGIDAETAVAAATTEPWRWPLDGTPVVVRPFLPPPQPWLPGHRGVDLAAPAGAVVRAAGAGTVTFAAPLAGRGVIVVRHVLAAGVGGPQDLRTTYEPVTASVRVGMVVPAGAALGRLAATGSHCPTGCLHWGLRRGEAYLDPLLLLTRSRARLLPVWRSEPRTSPGVPLHAGRRETSRDGATVPGAPPTSSVQPASGPRDRVPSPAAAAGGLALLTSGVVLWRRRSGHS